MRASILMVNGCSTALEYHNDGNNAGALNKTLYALDNLDALDRHNDNRVAAGKMGSVARDNIKTYSDDIRAALELVERLL